MGKPDVVDVTVAIGFIISLIALILSKKLQMTPEAFQAVSMVAAGTFSFLTGKQVPTKIGGS